MKQWSKIFSKVESPGQTAWEKWYYYCQLWNVQDDLKESAVHKKWWIWVLVGCGVAVVLFFLLRRSRNV